MDPTFITSILVEYLRLISKLLGKTEDDLFDESTANHIDKSKLFRNRFIHRIERLKDSHDEFLKRYIKEKILIANKKFDEKNRKDLLDLNERSKTGDIDFAKELELILSANNKLRDLEIDLIINSTIENVDESAENPIVKEFLRFNTHNKQKGDEIRKFRENVIFCSKVYPEMSNTWSVMEDRFPHLRNDEINELVVVLYNTINSNLRGNKNLAFVEFDEKEDLKLKIIELNYVLNKGKKKTKK